MNSKIKEELRSILENKLGGRINETDELRNLGLNSIDFVELVVQVENRFGILFPAERLTIESIYDFNELLKLVLSLCDEEESIMQKKEG